MKYDHPELIKKSLFESLDRIFNEIASKSPLSGTVKGENNCWISNGIWISINFQHTLMKYSLSIPVTGTNYNLRTKKGTALFKKNLSENMKGFRQQALNSPDWIDYTEQYAYKLANPIPPITFSITVKYPNGEFAEISGNTMWDYVLIENKVTMKFVNPNPDIPIESCRLNISYPTDEIPLTRVSAEFLRQAGEHGRYINSRIGG